MNRNQKFTLQSQLYCFALFFLFIGAYGLAVILFIVALAVRTS